MDKEKKGAPVGKVDKEKKNEPVAKLEEEFRDFQKEWKKFLENDFRHLVSNINTLVSQNKVMQRKVGIIEKNLLTVLKNTTIHLGK